MHGVQETTKKRSLKEVDMGKVTVVIKSDNVPTNILFGVTQKRIASKEFITAVIKAEYNIPKPDIKMYIIPIDED